MAAGRELDDYPQLTARMLDRLGQLIPRLAASGHDQLPQAFSELRTGFSVLHLQRDEKSCRPAGAGVQQVLDDVAVHYRQALALRQPRKPAHSCCSVSMWRWIRCCPASAQRPPVLTVLNALVELRHHPVSGSRQLCLAAPLPLATGGLTP
jgi:hypothetical protein